MEEELKNLSCVACKGDTPTLSEQEIDQYMKLLEKGWVFKGLEKDSTIERTFTFKTFLEAMSFENKVAEIAEQEGHHPDMYLFKYKKVRLTLTTHAAHGLTKNDFIVAAKVDALVRKDCICPRTCNCEHDTAGTVTGIHGDCPEHGDTEIAEALCPAELHWWDKVRIA